MSLVVIPANETDQWTAALDRMNYDVRDVHFTAAFARTHERDGATAHLAIYNSAEGWAVIQPFLKRPIPNAPGWFDVASMGYGGPLSDAPIPSRAHGAEYAAAWVGWMKANKIVCEFCLMNPLFETEQLYLVHDADTRLEKSVVVLPLDDEAAMIERMRHGRQGAIKAARNPDQPPQIGLQVEAMMKVPATCRTFSELYDKTMERNGASARWRLSHDDLARVIALADADLIFGGNSESGIMSAAIILRGNLAAYYYLAANSNEPKPGANELVILEAARRVRQKGCRWLHLGGGRTSDSADTLLDYKKSFGGIVTPVFSYQRVVDVGQYYSLCVEAGVDMAYHTTKATPRVGFFPAYRSKEAT